MGTFVGMRLFTRLLLYAFTLLIFSGSAGWVITRHLCSETVELCMDESSCCSEEMTCCSTEPATEQAGNDFSFSGGDDCCVSSSTYFSVPLYRLNAVRDLNPDFDFAFIIAFNESFRNNYTIDKPKPDYKPPAVNRSGNDILINTGLLLI